MDTPTTWQKAIKWLKHRWLTVSFVGGFITDTILLDRIDDTIDSLILLTYATLASITLLLFYIGVAQRLPEKISRFLVKFIPGVMQYAFGGLLSGMLIFYGRSGDWLTSSPFLLLIIVVIFGNEFVQKRSDRLVYNVALYFIGIFSYIVLILPVLFGAMGDVMFFLSGVVALLVVTLMVQLLHRIVPNFMRVNIKRVIVVIGTIYIALNCLYFTSVLPPIPLSLKQLDVVHSAVKSGDNYRLQVESQVWWRKIPYVPDVLELTTPSLSCFARVYAPAKLSTDIFHRWQYKDENGKWIDRPRIEYPIAGTNVGGYRGYTTISAVTPGFWRCSVETARGQVLGRKTVEVTLNGVGVGVVTQIR